MRRLTLALAVLGIFCGANLCGRVLAADAGVVKLGGTFVWDKKGEQTHPIKAAFTPNGDKKWNVVFTFDWGRGPQTWKGTAEGDLQNGAIKGEGFHPDGRRKFTFTGTVKNGQIDCTHNETTGGAPQATGTLTLKKE